MSELKPAYLIHGDDHGAVAERRAGLRALAERTDADGGVASVELFDGERATPAAVAGALAAMTLAVGWRVIVVEGVERWRDGDVERDLAPMLAQMPPETTLALFAREEARAKAPTLLHDAVKRAGGQVVAQMNVKPWELPKWAREQGARLGLSLDTAAAKALVAQVGERQQRLLRELEKLALERGDDDGARTERGESGSDARTIDAERIERRAARSTEWRAYALADALVGGDRREATQLYLRLREQGERLSGLVYLIASRLRDALSVAQSIDAGEPAASIKRGLRMPSRAADRLIADVQRTTPERLRAALGALADLELDSRGGAVVSSARSTSAALGEDTAALRAIQKIAG